MHGVPNVQITRIESGYGGKALVIEDGQTAAMQLDEAGTAQALKSPIDVDDTHPERVGKGGLVDFERQRAVVVQRFDDTHPGDKFTKKMTQSFGRVALTDVEQPLVQNRLIHRSGESQRATDRGIRRDDFKHFRSPDTCRASTSQHADVMVRRTDGKEAKVAEIAGKNITQDLPPASGKNLIPAGDPRGQHADMVAQAIFVEQDVFSGPGGYRASNRMQYCTFVT